MCLSANLGIADGASVQDHLQRSISGGSSSEECHLLSINGEHRP